MEQLVVLIMRCWKTRRLEAMGSMRLANFSFTGIIVGCLWWQVGQSDTLTRAADTTAMLFFMIVRPLVEMICFRFYFLKGNERACASLPSPFVLLRTVV